MPSHSKMFKLALAGGFQFAQGKIGFLAPQDDETQIKQLKKEKLELLTEKANWKGEKMDLMTERVELMKKLAGFNREKEYLTKSHAAEIADWRKEKASWKGQIANVRLEKDKLTHKLAALERKKAGLTKSHAAEIANLNVKIEHLTRAKAALMKENEKVADKDKKIAELVATVAELRKNNKAKDERIGELSIKVRAKEKVSVLNKKTLDEITRGNEGNSRELIARLMATNNKILLAQETQHAATVGELNRKIQALHGKLNIVT